MAKSYVLVMIMMTIARLGLAIPVPSNADDEVVSWRDNASAEDTWNAKRNVDDTIPWRDSAEDTWNAKRRADDVVSWRDSTEDTISWRDSAEDTWNAKRDDEDTISWRDSAEDTWNAKD